MQIVEESGDFTFLNNWVYLTWWMKTPSCGLKLKIEIEPRIF